MKKFADSSVGYFTLGFSKMNLALIATPISDSTISANPSIEQAKKGLLLSENELIRTAKITEFFEPFLL